MIEKLGLAALRQFEPEQAHGMALALLNAGLGPKQNPGRYPRLATTVAGLNLPNPLGLAAGFDKNAVALGPLAKTGFGFLEVGGTTPLPQHGNKRPRLFRLSRDQAVINRFGFNNDGVEAITQRLARRPRGKIVGLNIGANKTSPDRARDFAIVLETAGRHLDFATVNVSSPNTEKLRDLQGKEALAALLDGVLEVRAKLSRQIPIFLKIAPDLDEAGLDDIAAIAMEKRLDAIIATNTTLARDGLRSVDRKQAGGLSGAPLFRPSTKKLAQLYLRVGQEIPLIGVGGISNAEEAFEKIRAGASALQLYSALVFKGLSLVEEILRGLDQKLSKGGFETLADVVGSGAEDWAEAH